MTPDDLTERVARAIAEAEIVYFGSRSSLEQCMNWANEPDCYRQAARAAIAIALEEAAKVADDKTIGANTNDVFDAGWASACADIAAAIRALKKV